MLYSWQTQKKKAALLKGSGYLVSRVIIANLSTYNPICLCCSSQRLRCRVKDGFDPKTSTTPTRLHKETCLSGLFLRTLSSRF